MRISDAITLVRRQIWHNWVLQSPHHTATFHKLTTQQKHTLLELLTQTL